MGLFRFAIEGRRAPALFVTGWLGVLLGAGITLVGLLSPGRPALLLIAVGLALLTLGLVLLGGSQTVERTAAGLAYPGPSPILLFAATLAASPLLAIAIGGPLALAGVEMDRAVGDLISVGIQALVFVGLTRLMVVGPGAIRWSDMGFTIGGARIAGALALGAAYALPVVALTAVLALILVPLFGAAPPSPLPPSGTTGGLILHVIAGAVIAPVAEEIVFRGVAVTAWARNAGPTVAIVRAAVLFAVAHVLLAGGDSFGQAASFAIVGAAGRLPVALALGWIYVRSGTIWAPIGLHAVFNATLIVLAEAAVRSGAAG